MRHFVLRLGLFMTLILVGVDARAQVPNPSQMSNSQLLRYYQQAKASGMTDMEIEQAAMARGFTVDDIAKLRQRVEGAQSEGGNRVGGRDTLGVTRDRIQARPTQSQSDPLDSMDPRYQDPLGSSNQGRSSYNSQNQRRENNVPPLSETQKRIFGAPIFQNTYLDFAPDLRLATPKNYILGPDDELIVDIYGNSVDNFRLKVSPEGTVKMLNLAPVYVSGLSIEAASERIVSRLRQAFSSLNRPGSGTYANITLGNIRTINVLVTGDVARPGSYSVSSLSTAFNALYASGGPTENGSFRKIEVIRNNNVVAKIDLYEFIVNANMKNDIGLQDRDIIMVYPYQARVELIGEVKREGIFEASSSDTFADLIRYAGGYTSKAYTATIRYERNTGKELKIGLINADQVATFVPKDGDLYEIGEILNRYENSVSIEGSIYRPGFYAIEEGSSTVRELIKKAEGLTEDAFVNRAILKRNNEFLEAEVLSFDLGKLVRGEINDIPLRRGDKLVIKSVTELKAKETVSIQGAVNQGETFPYAEGMTVSDLIYLAGGYSEGATPYRVEVARRVKNDSVLTDGSQTTQILTFDVDRELQILTQARRFRLMPYDIVFVRKAPGYEEQKTLILDGEVMYPGRYAILSNNERISDIIQRAGGLRPSAYLAGARLTRQISSIQQQDSELLKELGNDPLMGRQSAGAQSPASVSANQTKIDSLRAKNSSTRQLVGLDLVSILNNPAQPANILVQDGDSILIPRQVETVRIIGEVLNPSLVNYDPKYSFNDYISQAGGYTDNARKRKVFVSYANGRVDRNKRFLFFNDRPTIRPGTTINVPLSQPKRENTTSPSERIAILSLISTLIFTVIRLF
jgi:polysaccharide export outer membrane protein